MSLSGRSGFALLESRTASHLIHVKAEGQPRRHDAMPITDAFIIAAVVLPSERLCFVSSGDVKLDASNSKMS
jgi:hypothetical protein